MTKNPLGCGRRPIEIYDMERAREGLRICLMSYRGNPYCGGQGVYVQCLARELVELGHEVLMVVGPPYPLPVGGVEVHRVGNLMFFGSSTYQILKRTSPSLLLSPLNLYEYASSRIGVFPEIRSFSFRAYFRLREIMRNRPFDVIHDNQCLGFGLLLLKGFGIPLVSTIHHPLTIDRRTWFEQPATLVQKVKMILYYPLLMQRIVANRMDRIITVSRDAAARISEDFGVPSERIRVVYNGIDPTLFRMLPDAEKVPRRIIFVGNVADRKKGILYLLQAMTFLDDDVELVVVDGGTPTRVSTAELIRSYGLGSRVRITGKIETEEVVRLYCSAQLAVVPSLYEGFGFPAAEAMACELPVVATKAGALPEVVGPPGEAGLLVPPRDPHALARAIAELLKAPERCRQMGKAARQRVLREFSWRRAASQLVEHYREVMECSR
jgi:glycosyltransferase involved in cell wall biosynthesis